MAIDLDLLRSLSAKTIETRLRSPRGVSEYMFEGPLLLDYATAAGLMPRKNPVGGLTNSYFLATAADGFKVVVSYTEAAPGYSSKSVILAYEQNGEPIKAGVRLVVPGDDLGDRSVFGLDQVELRSVPSGEGNDGLPSASVSVSGDVERPGVLSRTDLEALLQRSIQPAPSQGHGDKMRPDRVFRGVTVWDVLTSRGLQLDETINEHILRKVAVATGEDGFAVIIAAGEIEPRFQNAPFLVAFGAEPGDCGLRLVAPADLAAARSVKGLARLELRDG